jgi:hypothetical protein
MERQLRQTPSGMLQGCACSMFEISKYQFRAMHGDGMACTKPELKSLSVWTLFTIGWKQPLVSYFHFNFFCQHPVRHVLAVPFM